MNFVVAVAGEQTHTEIGDFHSIKLINQKIFRFDVPMNDPDALMH